MESIALALDNLVKILFASLITLAFTFSIGIQNIRNQVNDFINPPCSKPIAYKIGKVDTRFNITTQQLKQEIEKATLIWETPINKNLFEHNQEGTLTIDLIFDQRQSITNQIANLEGELKSQKENIKPQLDDYKRQSQEFNRKVQELNEEIDYWNSQGGAPQDVYERLKKQEQELKNEAESLNNLARSLNQLSDKYNVTVGELNETIGTYNEEISQKPEEGVYDPQTNTIEIYFITNRNELVHTLAHELGHALAIGHINNPKAIMYSQSTRTVEATRDDITALKTVCRIKSN